MSSRILASDTPIEPVRWRAPAHHRPGSPQTPEDPHGSTPERKDGSEDGSAAPIPPEALANHHHPADQARIIELEAMVKQLEQRLFEDVKNAREQGHHAGVAEGMRAGIEQESAKWSEAIARLGRTIEEMSKAKARFRAEVEEDAVKLALAIGRKVLHRELSSDPEALVGLARVALEKLNLRELQRVRVHPADTPAIEKLLVASSAPKRVEVIPDGTLERGGAIFETDRGMLDASVTTQLNEIERGLADMLGGTAK